MPDPPGAVYSEHSDANAAIGKLREVANTLKAFGDASLGREDERQNVLDATMERIAELEYLAPAEEWRDALDAFRLNLIDRDELLMKTLGVRA